MLLLLIVGRRTAQRDRSQNPKRQRKVQVQLQKQERAESRKRRIQGGPKSHIGRPKTGPRANGGESNAAPPSECARAADPTAWYKGMFQSGNTPFPGQNARRQQGGQPLQSANAQTRGPIDSCRLQPRMASRWMPYRFADGRPRSSCRRCLSPQRDSREHRKSPSEEGLS